MITPAEIAAWQRPRARPVGDARRLVQHRQQLGKVIRRQLLQRSPARRQQLLAERRLAGLADQDLARARVSGAYDDFARVG